MGGSVIQERKGMCFFWKISKKDVGDPPEKSWEVTARLMQLRRLHLPLLPCQVLLEEPQDPARVYANVFSRHFFSLSESLHKTLVISMFPELLIWSLEIPHHFLFVPPSEEKYFSYQNLEHTVRGEKVHL